MDGSLTGLNEDMTMADVGMWLNHHGFGEEVQECFESTMPNAW